MRMPTPWLLCLGLVTLCSSVLLLGSLNASAPRETIFSRLSKLEASHATASEQARQSAVLIQTHADRIDQAIESMSLTRRATGHVQKDLVTKQRLWDMWRRKIDRMTISESRRDVGDLRFLVRHAQVEFYKMQRSRQALLLQMDKGSENLSSMVFDHAKLYTLLAKRQGEVRSTRQAYQQEREAATQASAQVVAGDLAATDAALTTRLTELGKASPREDFHRLKGTLVPPVRLPANVRFEGAKKASDPNYVRRKGLAYDAPPGTPVVAVAYGNVVHVGFLEGYGHTIVLDHGGGYHSVYAHLGEVRVGQGERLSRSTVLGTSGDTGSLEGPIFYFELRARAQAVDPEPWFVRP